MYIRLLFQGKISIEIEIGPRVPNFGSNIAYEYKERYHPMYSVARSLGVSSRALSKVTGIVTFEPGRLNVGLNMKFSGRNEQVLGYSRKVEREDSFNNNNGNHQRAQWEFSDKAIALLIEYKEKFPRIFELLEEKPDASKYYVSDLEINGIDPRIMQQQPTSIHVT